MTTVINYFARWSRLDVIKFFVVTGQAQVVMAVRCCFRRQTFWCWTTDQKSLKKLRRCGTTLILQLGDVTEFGGREGEAMNAKNNDIDDDYDVDNNYVLR